MKWIPDRIVDALIERGRRTPYFKLQHADGSVYMDRLWLMPESMLEPIVECPGGFELRDDVRHLPAARLHHICTPDHDRELHNHPWSFVSIVLRGGYIERRPKYEHPRWYRQMSPMELPLSLNPEGDRLRMKMVERLVGPPLEILDEEPGYEVMRGVGSIAFRSYKDRHRIVYVMPDTWTLILQGPKRQSWGFFTETGFVPWREFESVHNTTAIR